MVQLNAAKTIQRFVKHSLNKENLSSGLAKVVEDVRRDERLNSFTKKVNNISTDKDNFELLQNGSDLCQDMQKEILRLRAENAKLRDKNFRLQEDVSKLTMNIVSTDVNSKVSQVHVQELQKQNNEISGALTEKTKSNRESKIKIGGLLQALKAASRKAEEEKLEMQTDHEKEVNRLQQKLDDMEILHETELYMLRRRHGEKCLALQEELREIKEAKEKEILTYEQSINSMISMVGEDEGNNSHLTSSSEEELQELRQIVVLSKIEYANNLAKAESEFASFRRNFTCQVCEQRKKKKFFGLFSK